MSKAKFLMVDGLDGSGKGTIIEAVKKFCEDSKLTILNLKEYCLEHISYPTTEEIAKHDVILSHEPSYSFIGRAIREELIDKAKDYSALSMTHAFALDREILYKKVIIPAIRLDKIIIQERGIITSVVYQPVQERIQLNEIIHLPGNKLALQHAPNLLVITKVTPEVAVNRNMGKNEVSTVFENLFFQRKIEERYNSEWLKSLFERFGTDVRYIDTNPPKGIEEIQKEAIELWKNLLARK